MGESSLSCPCSSQTPSYQKEGDELLEAPTRRRECFVSRQGIINHKSTGTEGSARA